MYVFQIEVFNSFIQLLKCNSPLIPNYISKLPSNNYIITQFPHLNNFQTPAKK